MTSIDKILIPVDFQSDSRTMLQMAVELARGHNARLVFLHVIDETVIEAVQQLSKKGYKGDFVQGMRKVVQDRERDIEGLTSGIRNEEIDVEVLVRKGDPAEKIIQVARDLSIKLIILGTRGLPEAPAVQLGKVAREVLTGAHCSVLLARPTEDVGVGAI